MTSITTQQCERSESRFWKYAAGIEWESPINRLHLTGQRRRNRNRSYNNGKSQCRRLRSIVNQTVLGKVNFTTGAEYKENPDEGTLGSHASDPVPENPGNKLQRPGHSGNQDRDTQQPHGGFYANTMNDTAEAESTGLCTVTFLLSNSHHRK